MYRLLFLPVFLSLNFGCQPVNSSGADPILIGEGFSGSSQPLSQTQLESILIEEIVTTWDVTNGCTIPVMGVAGSDDINILIENVTESGKSDWNLNISEYTIFISHCQGDIDYEYKALLHPSYMVSNQLNIGGFWYPEINGVKPIIYYELDSGGRILRASEISQ